jgi:hypothetical protein
MVRKFNGATRCVKDDLIGLPKALEEPEGSALTVAVLRCESQNFGYRPLAVDGAEQLILESVDGENKIGECMRSIDQHRDAARGQTFPNAYGPWQCNGNVVAPMVVRKVDRFTLIGAIITVRDEAVRDHRSPEQLDGGVLQARG